MKIEHKYRVRGLYRLRTFRNGEMTKDTGWFDNLVLDAGLERIGTSAAQISHCQVGTGSTAPSATDTALVSLVAGTNSITATNSGNAGTGGSDPYYAYRQKTFEFAEGVAEGILAEVGCGWASSGSLFSRALILDEYGNPTTLTVLSDEILHVDYELRLYAPVDDVTGYVTISSVEYAYTSRASSVTSPLWSIGTNGVDTGYTVATAQNAYDGAIGAVTTTPSGINDSASSRTEHAYSALSYELACDVVWGIADANFDIMSFRIVTGCAAYQLQFDPVIPKTSSEVLSLTFKHSWDRY